MIHVFDVPGLRDVLSSMRRDFDLGPSTETLHDYVLPYFLKGRYNLPRIIIDLSSCGVPSSVTCCAILTRLLDTNKLKEAANVARQYICTYKPRGLVKTTLMKALLNTYDVDSFVSILQGMSTHIHYIGNRETEGDIEGRKVTDHREFCGEIVEQAVRKLLRRNNHEEAQKLIEVSTRLSGYHVPVKTSEGVPPNKYILVL